MMSGTDIFKNEAILADWICKGGDFDTFVTLTLKQGLPCDTFVAALRANHPRHVREVATIFRDRLSVILGSGRIRGGHKLPVAAFVEGDEFTRTHLHFLVQKPSDAVDLMHFRMAVCCVASKLTRARGRIDIRPITYGSPTFVAEYCLKTGTDAFMPEASFLRD